MLANMLAISAAAHRMQRDKSGRPYFLYCLAVMQLLGDDANELADSFTRNCRRRVCDR
jgi:(p)ppGpp synthase/HD superfamily hydrolase